MRKKPGGQNTNKIMLELLILYYYITFYILYFILYYNIIIILIMLEQTKNAGRSHNRKEELGIISKSSGRN